MNLKRDIGEQMDSFINEYFFWSTRRNTQKRFKKNELKMNK